MVSTTSGTTAFNLDVDDVIEQALQPLGGEHQSGIGSDTARRVLNLVLIQMQNKNIPLHKLDFIDQALTEDDGEYTLAASVVDILKCSIQKDSEVLALPISRRGLKEYQDIPNKTQGGRPSLYTVERLIGGINLILWPIPDDTGPFTAKLLVAKRVEDISASYQKIDIPYRYLPLLIKWLSYELACSKPGIPDNLKDRLKMDLKDAKPNTFDEYRERTDFVITPHIPSGR